jgi:hypothetical protein
MKNGKCKLYYSCNHSKHAMIVKTNNLNIIKTLCNNSQNDDAVFRIKGANLCCFFFISYCSFVRQLKDAITHIDMGPVFLEKKYEFSKKGIIWSQMTYTA